MTRPKTRRRRNDTPVPATLRLRVFRRDHFACVYCGATDAELTVDHVVPRSWGGPNHSTNLVTACLSCNSGDKGALDLVSYARKLRALGAPARDVRAMIRRVRHAGRRPLPRS